MQWRNGRAEWPIKDSRSEEETQKDTEKLMAVRSYKSLIG